MCMWFPLHKLPPLILETKIPPTMNSENHKFRLKEILLILVLFLYFLVGLLHIVTDNVYVTYTFLGLSVLLSILIATMYLRDM